MKINLNEEIKAMIKQALDGNAERRGRGSCYGGGSCYITASDIERNLREEFQDRMNHGRVRISGLNGLPLISAVRDELRHQVSQGILKQHNFGKGHCSGARFRRVADPLSPQEEKRLAVPRDEMMRRKFITHLARETDGKAACGAGDRPSRGYSRRSGFQPTPTAEAAKVTCKRCRKLIEAAEKEAANV